VEILGLLLKNKFRAYRRYLFKRSPFFGALLVFILFFTWEILPVIKANMEWLRPILPKIYHLLLVLIASRRILFSKHPPFCFSLPGLYFFFTTPVNHYLVLTGKLLLSYFPMLIISFGLSRLAAQLQAGFLHGAHLFFYLVATANFSWLLYNSNSKRIYLWRFFIFLAMLILIFLDLPSLFWLVCATGGFLLAINSTDKINWSKYESHCKLAYLTSKYFLNGDWGGLESLMYEYKEPPGPSLFFTRIYVSGYKAFTYGQILIMSRYPFLAWLIFLCQCAVAAFILQTKDFLPFFGGTLLLLSGIVSPFSLPVQKTIQKNEQGFFLPGGFIDFFRGMALFPLVVSFVVLMIILSILADRFNPIWHLAAPILPAVALSYLVVVKGVFRSVFSGWFIAGTLLFGLFFFFIRICFFRGVFLVLCLFIPYLFVSWRRMRIIYEGEHGV